MEQQYQDIETGKIVRLYKEAFPGVAKAIKRYGGTEDDARDVFQDVLLAWYEKPVQDRAEVMNVSAYIFVAARNEWFRRVEKAEKVREAWLELPGGEEVNVSGDLYDYLVRTGKKCLRLLQAFYYEKLRAERIASEMGFSCAHSASAQKYKCLEKLRQMMRKAQMRKEDFYE